MNHADRRTPLRYRSVFISDVHLGVRIQRDAVHQTADGCRLWVVHGDEFDAVVQCNRLVTPRDGLLEVLHWSEQAAMVRGLEVMEEVRAA